LSDGAKQASSLLRPRVLSRSPSSTDQAAGGWGGEERGPSAVPGGFRRVCLCRGMTEMSYGAIPDLSSTAQGRFFWKKSHRRSLWCRSGPGFTARCECVRHGERTGRSRAGSIVNPRQTRATMGYTHLIARTCGVWSSPWEGRGKIRAERTRKGATWRRRPAPDRRGAPTTCNTMRKDAKGRG
jgi:hypothetical protein